MRSVDTVQFDATAVSWSEEFGTLTVGAHRDAQDAAYLMFQRSLADDEELYVELNDQSFGAYGAVQQLRLRPLECSLRPAAGKHPLPQQIVVGLGELPTDRVLELAAVLRLVASGLVEFEDLYSKPEGGSAEDPQP